MKRSLPISMAVAALVLAAVAAGWRLAIFAVHALALQRLALARGMRVADIGCGSGRLSARIARVVGPSGDVVGIDIDPRAVRAARRRLRATGLGNVQVILAAAGRGHSAGLDSTVWPSSP